MAKTEMNSFDVAAAVREMDVAGARVDKAYQPAPDEILLRVRRSAAEGGRTDLAFGPGRYAFATRVPRANPTTPSNFAVSLRKHLGGGFVRGVRQHAFDRVVVVDVERKEGRYELVVELFHDGNAVLVREGKILATILQQAFAHRTIRPGVPYEFPPERVDPRRLTEAAFESRVRASKADVVRTLATEINLGGLYAEEVCARAGVDKSAPAESLDQGAMSRLHAALAALAHRVTAGELDPVIVVKEGERVDVAPFPLAAHEGLALERFATFQEALDAYFSKPVEVERHDTRADKAKEESDRLARQLAQQEQAVARFEQEEAEARKKGDLLFGHFQDVQDVLAYLARATRDTGWERTRETLKEHRLGKLVERLFEHEGAATLALPDEAGKPVRVRVDIRKNVQENAQDAYGKAKKLREKQVGAAVAMAATRRALAEARTRGVALAGELERDRARPKPTQRFWFEAFRWFLTSDGHLVLGGRDASTNEKVVKKHLAEQDRYVHADLHGAPSLVVKAKGSTPPSEAALVEAAVYAVAMSKAWTTGHASGEAYWVLPSQVTKTPQSGEFLAKGAFVIRGKRNHLSVDVRLALGEIEFEGHRKLMCGPSSAVEARSTRYLTLVPGREEKNAFAKRASALFHVPIEEVLSVLPPGGVEVVGGSPEPLRGPAS